MGKLEFEMTEETIYKIELTENEMLLLSASNFVATVSIAHPEFCENIEEKFQQRYVEGVITIIEDIGTWKSLLNKMAGMIK
jgi:DNA-binding TFAR19-related protein (PDSD5 family)